MGWTSNEGSTTAGQNQKRPAAIEVLDNLDRYIMEAHATMGTVEERLGWVRDTKPACQANEVPCDCPARLVARLDKACSNIKGLTERLNRLLAELEV